MTSILVRTVGTCVALALWTVAQVYLRATATVIGAEAAVGQLANSDAAAVGSQVQLAAISHMQLPSILLLAILVAIWFSPLRAFAAGYRRGVGGTSLSLAAALGAGLLLPLPADAFYATTDVTEVVYILPNWSAFYIPDTGANKTTQAAFGSVDYLNAAKIAAKRFIIPHSKLSGTGGTSAFSGADYYVPDGKLIVVDRTPFFREWVDASDRGTSFKKQGFHFETLNSVNIGTGITISAFVSPENAASFLYWFGTKAVDGDTSRPEVQFLSVLRGMSLADVMDGIVRAKVQEMLASEFGKRNFNEAIAQKTQIIKAVTEGVKAEFESKGISIGFLGYAGPLDFSDAIQASIDGTVVAERQKAMADTLKDSLGILQTKAMVDAVSTLAAKWDGKAPSLPSVLVVPDVVAAAVGSLGKPAASPTAR